MRFTVKAFDLSQGVLVYAIDAPDETDARRQVVDAGRQLISLARRAPVGGGGKGRVPLVIFSQELVALLDAGISLVEAVETLTEKETQPAVRRTMEQIRLRLFEGRTLSSALAELPHSFPPLYVATIRASERSGAIRESLTRYIAYQQQIDVLRKKLVNASIYPLVLMGAGTLVTFFLLGFVVPRFSSIYEDLGSDLPFASRMLMQWGKVIEGHGLAVAAAAAACLGLAAWWVTRPAFRAAAGRLVARIPAVGTQLHTYQLARMYRTVGMLLRGGIPAVTALGMSEGLLSATLRPALAAATLAVREGRSLASSLELHGLTTPVAVRMLRVGERSGNMGEMMERVAGFYDDELGRAVEVLTRLIEPALMALIGLVIGVIVVLMYFPIFELAGSLQ